MSLEKVKKKILEVVDKKRDEAVEFLRTLVKVRSVTGEEGEAQKIMENKFRKIGFDVDVFEPDLEEIRKHPKYVPIEISEKKRYKGRPNVVGHLRGANGGNSIIVWAHIDTVPPGPEETLEARPLRRIYRRWKNLRQRSCRCQRGISGDDDGC